jgi:hypothetical protein
VRVRGTWAGNQRDMHVQFCTSDYGFAAGWPPTNGDNTQIRIIRAAWELLQSRHLPMSDRDTFGPRLRREREWRRISLDTIASVTKVSVDLWDGLERNDFSRWPSGVFARAFVRDYARAVGLDADEVVNEFCRLFPIGDRRAGRLLQAQAELIGHRLSYAEHGGIPPGGDRRARPPEKADERTVRRAWFAPRLLAAAIDVCSTAGLAALTSLLPGVGFWTSLGVLSLPYYVVGILLLGGTPGSVMVQILKYRMPALFLFLDRRRATA